MTFVSIAGVAVGVAALIIVLSVMGGFEQDLRQKMLGGQPHLEVIAKENAILGFSLQKHSQQSILAQFPLQPIQASPFVRADVVLQQRKHVFSATLIGIDPAGEGEGWAFHNKVIEGNLADLVNPQSGYPGIVLGEGLGLNLSVQIGDLIDIVTPEILGMGDVLSGRQVIHRFEVVGFFRANAFDFDQKWAVVTLSDARKFMPEYSSQLDDEEFVTGLAVTLADHMQVDLIKKHFVAHSELAVLTWKDVNSSLLFALLLEKFAMGAILMLIVVVAAFSISGTMMMMVFHRRQQVSLLRALGMSKSGIAKLYLVYGGLIGGLGIFIGVTLGVSVCAFIYYFSNIPLPAGAYYLPSLPLKWLPVEYLIIGLGALGLSLVAAVYPAMMASRLDPSGGLRYR